MKAKIFATVMTLMLTLLTCVKICASESGQPVSVKAAEYVVSSAERLSEADLSVLALVAERYDLPYLEEKLKEAAEMRLEDAEEQETEAIGYFFELYEDESDVRFRRALRAKWNKIRSDRSFDSYAFRAEYARRYGPKDHRDSIYSEVVSRFIMSKADRSKGYFSAMLSALDNLPEKQNGRAEMLAIVEELASEPEPEDSWEYIYSLLKSLRMGYLDESEWARASVLYESANAALNADYASLDDCQLSCFVAASLEYEAWNNVDYSEDRHREPAFKGAEGGGRYTSGGKGGRTYLVTTLEDNGEEGSLRHAVEAEGAREVRFAVEGEILLKKPLKIRNPYISILGQTAPGEGITIRNYGLSIEADEVIVRYLRLRPGDGSAKECDALEVRHSDHVIIDHCSLSWATDENLSFYACSNSTLQWCIISESLNSSVHSKGEHGYGGIWGGRNISFHHNLIVSNNSRNPRLDHPAVYEGEDLLLRRGSVDFSNNVLFNWGMKAVYGGERGWFNICGNYFKAGPATRQLKGEYLEIYTSETTSMQPGSFHIAGNVYDVSAVEQTGNYRGKFPDGEAVAQQAEEYARVSEPQAFELRVPVRYEPAREAYLKVLKSAGASLKRDATDVRIVEETLSGQPRFKGSVTGLPGIIDSVKDLD